MDRVVYNILMKNEPKMSEEYPLPFLPEVVPQLIPMPEIKKETPPEVINGALEEINRREKEDNEPRRKPTIH